MDPRVLILWWDLVHLWQVLIVQVLLDSLAPYIIRLVYFLCSCWLCYSFPFYKGPYFIDAPLTPVLIVSHYKFWLASEFILAVVFMVLLMILAHSRPFSRLHSKIKKKPFPLLFWCGVDAILIMEWLDSYAQFIWGLALFSTKPN